MVASLLFPITAAAQARPYSFSTLAGNASFGVADGVGDKARFRGPVGIAVDGPTNVYVADINNHTIRRIIASGTNWVVTTIAGSAGNYGSVDGTNSEARFYGPHAIAVDSSGNLFVADFSNCTIRKVTPVGTNWVVSTIAGSAGNQGSADGMGSAASFHSPHGIAADGLGNLYVTEFLNYGIRKLTPVGTNWLVSTIVGAADVYGSADGTNNHASFKQPTGIAVDVAGNVYVTDVYNHSVRKITPSGPDWVVTTIAGSSAGFGSNDGTNSGARFQYPTGLTVDTNGNLYLTEIMNNHRVRKITPTGTNWVVATIAGSVGISGSADGTNTDARFLNAHGIVADQSGNLFVADTGNSTIRKITPFSPSWVVTTIAGRVGGAGSANGLAADARFNSPSSITVDPAANVYVADTQNSVIRKIEPVGTDWMVSTIAGLAGNTEGIDGTNSNARFYNPGGIAVDESQNIYVADTLNCTIRQLISTGPDWVVRTIAGRAGYQGSLDGANGNARFNNPGGVAAEPNGGLYVSDSANNTIRKLTPLGTNWVVSTIAGLAQQSGSLDGTNGAARFNNPQGLAATTAGRIYVADQLNYTIRELLPVGTNWAVSTIAGLAGSIGSSDGTNNGARFYKPYGIAADEAGNIYVAEYGMHTLRKLMPVGTNWVVTTIGGRAQSNANVDGVGTNARFYGPKGIAVDKAGNLFVADTSNHTIRLGTLPPLLRADVADNRIILSWPASAVGFVLETASNLTVAAWTTATNSLWNQNGRLVQTNNVESGTVFYRLHSQ